MRNKNQGTLSDTAISDEINEQRRIFLNGNIIGCLSIPETDVDYPVTQYVDNNYYSNHDIYRKENKAGTIFMDCNNNASELDRNTVIYGKSISDGSLFQNLEYYESKQFYNAHNSITLITLSGKTEWWIFSVYSADDGTVIETQFEDENAFSSFLLQAKEKSAYDTGVTVKSTDKVLTLAVLSDVGETISYVLHAKQK